MFCRSQTAKLHYYPLQHYHQSTHAIVIVIISNCYSSRQTMVTLWIDHHAKIIIIPRSTVNLLWRHRRRIESSSSLSSAAAAVTMTSSGHVTETDTPTNQAHVTDAAVTEYSVLDTATIADPPSLPSVYQTLNDRNPSS